MSGYLGSIGFALPASLGAWAAVGDDRPVIAVAGDGGFGMMVQELETVNRLQIAPLFVIYVDQALSLIRLPQQLRGYPSRGIDLAPVDWAAVARGFGIHGVWATTEHELTRTLDEWRSERKATVLAVRTDETLYRGNSY